MYLALDVHYKTNHAKTVGVFFNLEDKEPRRVIITYSLEVNDYIPGQFYKRELPCLLEAITKVDLNTIKVIVVDGHVYVDNGLAPGLGTHLYNALNKKIPVIGVAKKAFLTNAQTVLPLLRGTSKTPLYISAIGMELSEAVKGISSMHGEYRMPTILKTLDRLTKID